MYLFLAHITAQKPKSQFHRKPVARAQIPSSSLIRCIVWCNNHIISIIKPTEDLIKESSPSIPRHLRTAQPQPKTSPPSKTPQIPSQKDRNRPPFLPSFPSSPKLQSSKKFTSVQDQTSVTSSFKFCFRNEFAIVTFP